MVEIQEVEDEPSIEELLGKSLLTSSKGTKKSTKEVIQNKDFILLYFSANWCPPCKAFSPVLTDFYNKMAKDAKLEIVYVSSDKTVAEFEEYYSKMPWAAIPTDQGAATIKNNLAQKLKLVGIPTLVVLTSDGKFITDEARRDVQSAGKDGYAKVVEGWKAKEPVPISEAQTSNQQMNPLLKFLLGIMKHPAFIFAFIYFVKWANRKWKEYTAIDQEL